MEDLRSQGSALAKASRGLLAAVLLLASAADAQKFLMVDRSGGLAPVGSAAHRVKEVEVSSRTFLRYNSVSGNKSRSFFAEGWFYEQQLSVQEAGINGRGNEYQFNADVRFTNEDRVDPESVLLQNLSYREWNDRYMLEVGDFFHEFNHLTLNRNLKGVAYTRFAGEDRGPWTYTMLAGVEKSRWRELFVDTATETLTRWTFGFRGSREWRGGKDTMGVNLVHSRDSRNSAPQNPGLGAGESSVLSFDGMKTFSDSWRGLGVVAFSKSDPGLGTTGKDQYGSAVNLDLQFAPPGGRASGRTRFQSTDPDYRALSGAAVPDFEKFDTAWRYQVSDNLEMQAKYETFENNLDGQVGFTTETDVPSVAATYRAPSRPLRVDLRWEDRDIGTSNNSRDQDIQDWSFRAEDRFGQVRTVVDYNDREDRNNLTATSIDSDQWTFTVDTRIRAPKTGAQWVPQLTYQVRNQTNLVAPTVVDKVKTLQARIGLLLPRKRNIQMVFRGSERADGRRLNSSATEGYEVSYTQPVGDLREDLLSFRLIRNYNRYQLFSNNFDEISTQLAYSHRF